MLASLFLQLNVTDISLAFRASDLMLSGIEIFVLLLIRDAKWSTPNTCNLPTLNTIKKLLQFQKPFTECQTFTQCILIL